ncbi:MAG: lysophospholipid acyltransferase family protein [Candidatus Nanopelagicales bacterium]|nr:lysophospholipid acyltransferase family protein [Candidatus Nanopelagicales bacterium]
MLFPKGQALGPWYRFAVCVLWPPMMGLTRRDWRGAEHLGKPGEGCVVAANHLSWFDPIVVAHFLNDNNRAPRFLAKDRLFEVPVVGSIVGNSGQIPVYRATDNASDSVRAAVDAVEQGEAVLVYPDGTLTRDPDLWPMTGKTGAARISLLSGCPVIPVAHWGAQDVMRPYKKELRVLPPKTMRVAAGPPVDLDDLRGLPMTTEVVEEATTRIVDAITDLLADLRNERPPTERWSRRLGKRVPVHRGLDKPRSPAPKTIANQASKKVPGGNDASPPRPRTGTRPSRKPHSAAADAS